MASATLWPCPTSTSACRSLATISSGTGRFLDRDPSSWPAGHTNERTTPVRADRGELGPSRSPCCSVALCRAVNRGGRRTMRALMVGFALLIDPTAGYATCACVCLGGQSRPVCSLPTDVEPICQQICTLTAGSGPLQSPSVSQSLGANSLLGASDGGASASGLALGSGSSTKPILSGALPQQPGTAPGEGNLYDGQIESTDTVSPGLPSFFPAR